MTSPWNIMLIVISDITEAVANSRMSIWCNKVFNIDVIMKILNGNHSFMAEIILVTYSTFDIPQEDLAQNRIG